MYYDYGCALWQWLCTLTTAVLSDYSCWLWQWICTVTMTQHFDKSCELLHKLWTVTMVVHSDNGCALWQWMCTLSMAVHSDICCALWKWQCIVTIADYSDNGCVLWQWQCTLTKAVTIKIIFWIKHRFNFIIFALCFILSFGQLMSRFAALRSTSGQANSSVSKVNDPGSSTQRMRYNNSWCMVSASHIDRLKNNVWQFG